jgi:hypothetical protein
MIYMNVEKLQKQSLNLFLSFGFSKRLLNFNTKKSIL